MRHAARRDSNDKDISDALKAAGFRVIDLAGVGVVPDKLVCKLLQTRIWWTCWVEIKTEKGRLTETQKVFGEIFGPRAEFYVARSPQEAVDDLWKLYSAEVIRLTTTQNPSRT